MNPGFWRFFLMFIAVMAIFRFAVGRRRWRRRWERVPQDRIPGNDLTALEERLSLVERLENRVEELENRLDFTERLLQNRASTPAQ